jgi:serine/threonine protein kinase
VSAPKELGPYCVWKKLGSGATATTFLATEHDRESGTTLVACLKVPHLELLRHRNFIEAFWAEAHIASKLHHDNIIQLERVARAQNGLPFLAYDFVDGMDFGELIAAIREEKRAQLDWMLVIAIFREIASALEEAHTDYRGTGRVNERPAIIHRDIAASNIVLGLSGNVYVADFGLAKALDFAALRLSAPRGRIAYCAPEYLQGEAYDARADLYSVGVLLFEALTLTLPFSAVHMSERDAHLKEVRTQRRPRIDQRRGDRFLRAEFDPRFDDPPPGLRQLADITDRLLDPNPDARIQSARDLADELGAIAIPPRAHMRRVLTETVQHYQPAERRIGVWAAGAHTMVGPWDASSAKPTHQLVRPGSTPHDGIRLDEAGAARLIEVFANQSNVSLDEAITAYAATDLERPAVQLEGLDPQEFVTTDPLRPPIDANALRAAAMANSTEPIIPTTRTSSPAVATPIAHEAQVGSQVSYASYSGTSFPGTRPTLGSSPQASWADPSTSANSAPLPNPLALTHVGLPAYESSAPSAESSASTSPRTFRLGALALAIALLSMLVLSTMDRLLVPLITGQLGYNVTDHLWTPVLTYGAYAGIGIALVLAVIAALSWRKRRSEYRALSR